MSAREPLTCRHCGDPFLRPAYLDLHVGRAHPATLSGDEREAYEKALAEEDAWLAEFQRHVKGGLVALPIVVTYLLIILTLEISGLGFAWGLLLLPGVAAFAVMAYVLTYTGSKKNDADTDGAQAPR